MTYKLKLSFFESTNTEVCRDLLKAEADGLSIFKTRCFGIDKDKLGFIIHDISENKEIKNIWELTEIDKDTDTTTFKVIQNEYWLKYNTYISDEQFYSEIEQLGLGLLKIGRYGIDRNGNYCCIFDIAKQTVTNRKTYDNILNPNRYEITSEIIVVKYKYEHSHRRNEGIFQIDTAPITDFCNKWAIIEDDIKAHTGLFFKLTLCIFIYYFLFIK